MFKQLSNVKNQTMLHEPKITKNNNLKLRSLNPNYGDHLIPTTSIKD